MRSIRSLLFLLRTKRMNGKLNKRDTEEDEEEERGIDYNSHTALIPSLRTPIRASNASDLLSLSPHFVQCWLMMKRIARREKLVILVYKSKTINSHLPHRSRHRDNDCGHTLTVAMCTPLLFLLFDHSTLSHAFNPNYDMTRSHTVILHLLRRQWTLKPRRVVIWKLLQVSRRVTVIAE